MRIAVTAPFYVPAVRAGGPVPGIQGVVRTLGGHDVWVFTGDRDLGDNQPYPAPHVGTTWVDGTRVSYLGPLRPGALRPWVRALRRIRDSDVVYVNSCFSAPFTLFPLLGLKCLGYGGQVVISPRGELAASALRLGHRLMKRAWLAVIRALAMHRSIGGAGNVVWLASSELEAADIERHFTDAEVAISAERLRPWHGPTAEPVPPGGRPLRVVSVGRIAPIKGTLELVRGVAGMPGPVELRLIGFCEDADYVRQVERAIAACPPTARVEMIGPLPPDRLRTELLDADLFALLTHGENFGHAIGEALQTGLPVLISDQTPWSFVAEQDAGTVLTIGECGDARRVAEALARFAASGLAERQRRSKAAIESVHRLEDATGQVTLLSALRGASAASEPAGPPGHPITGDELPRVLVVSHNPFSNTQNNGKTLSGFFAGWPADRLGQLYVTLDAPDFDVCRRFYRVSDLDMLRRNLGLPTKYTGPISPAENVAHATAPPPCRFRRAMQNRAPLALLLRSALWRRRHWYTAGLRDWLDELDPEVVFFQSSNSTFAFQVVQQICRDREIPLVMETTDDYVTAYPTWWPSTVIYQRAIARVYAAAVESASTVFAIGDQMAGEYRRRFGGRWEVAMNSVGPPARPGSGKTDRRRLRLVFSGNLGLNRWRVLAALGTALDRLARRGLADARLEIYSLQQPAARIRHALTVPGRSEFRGARSTEELARISRDADFLVHVESFDIVNRRRARLSVSTKIPEYLAAGRDVLAIGPADLASIRYLRDHDAAAVVHSADPDRIAEAIICALDDSAGRAVRRANARELVERNHLRPVIRQRIRRAVVEAVAGADRRVHR